MTPPATSFSETFRSIDDVEGWMTEGQARRLWDRASVLKDGDQIVEIGSYHGRSAIVLGTSAPEGVAVFAIDPHAGNDRGPQQIEGPAEDGQRDHETFMANLEAAGVRDRITHVRLPSQQAGAAVEGEFDLLYIDGAHRYIPARDDIRDYGARVAVGGTMLIHDSFSSVGVTLALMAQLFWSNDYRYIGRESSMSEYRRDSIRGVQKVRNLVRQVAELPWFARNVVIKVLIVAKLGRLTKYLGHRQANWPY